MHDAVKDKDFELEMSWVGAGTPSRLCLSAQLYLDSEGKHQSVPKELFDEAEKLAKVRH